MTSAHIPNAPRPAEANEGPNLSVLLENSVLAVAEGRRIPAALIVETLNEAAKIRSRERLEDIQAEATRPKGEYSKVKYDVIKFLRLRGYEDVRIDELPPSIDRWLNRERTKAAISEGHAAETQDARHHHSFVVETPFAQTGVLSLSSKGKLTPREIEEIEAVTNALSTRRLWEQAEYYKPFLTDAELIRILDERHETTHRVQAVICLVDTAKSTERQNIVTMERRPSLTIPVLTQETLGEAVLTFNRGMDSIGPTVQGDRPGDATFNYAFMDVESSDEAKVSAAVSAIETAVQIQRGLMTPKHEEAVLQIEGKVVLSFGSVDAQNIGKPGDKSRGVMFTGPSINTLARVEKRAAAGQILVVHDTLEKGGIADQALEIYMSTVIGRQEITVVEGFADPSDPEQAAGLKGLTEKVRYTLITLPKGKEPEFPRVESTSPESDAK